MGRWAQRRLGNGGGGSGAAPILILSAEVQPDTLHVDVAFDANISVGDFAAANFSTGPILKIGTAVAQLATDTLRVTFGSDVSINATLTYAGTAPNVSTPQTIDLT